MMALFRTRATLLTGLCAIYAGVFALSYSLHITWNSSFLQYAASGFYVAAVLLLIGRIYMRRKAASNRTALLLMGLELVLLLGVINYPLLVLPWMALVPWLAVSKAVGPLQALNGLVHLAAVLLLLVVLLVKGFVAELTLAEVHSPDSRQAMVITKVDEGALGGSTKGVLRKFFGPFIYERTVYVGPYREECSVLWKDNRYLTIDGFELDAQSRKITREQRSSR